MKYSFTFESWQDQTSSRHTGTFRSLGQCHWKLESNSIENQLKLMQWQRNLTPQRLLWELNEKTLTTFLWKLEHWKVILDDPQACQLTSVKTMTDEKREDNLRFKLLSQLVVAGETQLFLSIRFYVKSLLVSLKMLKSVFLAIFFPVFKEFHRILMFF